MPTPFNKAVVTLNASQEKNRSHFQPVVVLGHIFLSPAGHLNPVRWVFSLMLGTSAGLG